MDADPSLARRVEQFPFSEADCLDRHAYDEWLALEDEDLLYWCLATSTIPIPAYENAGNFPSLWRWIASLAARPGVAKGMTVAG
jgi:succinate dehydrogenase flavin-adding protein (antitoxin of CptAB toxin-antitoxin module)